MPSYRLTTTPSSPSRHGRNSVGDSAHPGDGQGPAADTGARDVASPSDDGSADDAETDGSDAHPGDGGPCGATGQSCCITTPMSG